ncbi:uncharacterized protein E0L32_006586 [Thyridium curvatum]|uniref:Zn(2)-C6 fungal-type domain-containing protein n=1 Tax=Thyridium curvatum TaxID=1093900 RepID=A0A507B7A0_9PEZI|nr:uncharacterized protein E0L32_006586 [Thyridium curvatum]TPX12941.1 hypothetical protein E0L32_006586 [Thyridium curvatum]
MFDSLDSLDPTLLSPAAPQETQPRKQRQRRWHPRSFTGCFNCRKRHVKCDEKSPSCANCRRLSLDCRYESGGRFTFRAVRPAQSPRSSPRVNGKETPKPREELPQALSPEELDTAANLDIDADFETPVSHAGVDDLVLMNVSEQDTWDSQLASFFGLLPLSSPAFAEISTPDTTYYHHFIDTVSTMLIIWDTPSNSNPYRLLPRLSDSSGLLRNTMVALGAMHMANLPAMAQRNVHQRAAMEAYGFVITQLKSLRPVDEVDSELELLATTLLLCMFEKMNSADCNWKVHLEGARQIFETIYRPRPLALTANRKADQQIGSNLIAVGQTDPGLIAPMRRFLVSLMAYLDVAAACATGKGTLIPGDYWETLGGGWEYNLGAPSFQPPRAPTDRSLGQIRQSWSRLMAIQADISGFASMSVIDDNRREIMRESLARRIADWHESGPDVYVRLSTLDSIPPEESEVEVELLRAAACVQCYASACSIYLDRVATQKLCRGATEAEIATAAEYIIRLSSNFSGGLSRMAHLWSLFTAGTATTDDTQKEALRDLLTEMKSFGFKHISRALDILEYVWLQQRLYGEADYQAFTELASTALFP